MSFFWQISCAVVLWKGMENAGVLDVFPIYHTEVTEQKIRSPAADELLRFRQCLFTAYRFGQSLSGGVVDSEQDEQQQIVADHAPPSADQPHPQQAGTQERTENADAPHSGDVEQKRNCGFSDSLHQPLQHNGHPIERYCGRHLHPPDDGAAETGGKNRQDDSHCQSHEGRLGGGSFGPFLLSRADRLEI